MSINPQEHVSLAEHTTLQLGGKARYFIECKTLEELRSALEFARSRGLRHHILGGGSNTIFHDDGFDGLVIKIALRGIQFIRLKEDVKMVCAAGEVWDSFVERCIEFHLGGVECLSGIPGLVGAAPIQNVGAYGQEVSETIAEVKALNTRTLSVVHFTNSECKFGYRRSRFNREDQNVFVITEVAFRLHHLAEPCLRYPELQQYVATRVHLDKLGRGCERLQAVRDAVLALRRKKSMVLDAHDPHAKSVGSFFKNPVLSPEQLSALEERCRALEIAEKIPTFPFGDRVKVPAAWLLEHAGFHKGYRTGGVGISENHALALVNYGGSTRELLLLAGEIQARVREKFGVTLEREPVLVQ